MIHTKKCLSIALVFCLIFGSVPAIGNPAYAASTPEKDVAMNALDALGFDTSKMPEGYDANSTKNPYGGKTTTINPVRELYVSNKDGGKLYGDNLELGEDSVAFYGSERKSASAPVYDAYRAAAGDFTGDGLSGEVATVAANKEGGLYLYLTDPATANSAGVENTKLLLPTTKIMGNKGRYDKEDFTAEPYQLQNYLQTTTGDFDGDGYDEIAVYLPEQGDSRVAVYKLKVTSGSTSGSWLEAENWELAWTRSLNESPYVSNMVSLTASEMTGDGIDDLAITWGVYYGKDYKTKCQATVLYGSKSGTFLQKSSDIALTYGTSEIVRAAFTFGDADGDGKDELVLGGQLEKDIDAAEYNTRFLAIYECNQETDFVRTSAENMSMIEKNDDTGQRPATEDGSYFSAPACVANVACVKMDGIGTKEYIYLDSVLYQEKGGSFEIKVELDETADMRDARIYKDYPYYAEYNAIAADFNGDGKEIIQVAQYFLPFDTKVKVRKYWWFFPIGWTTNDVFVPGAGFLKEIDPCRTRSTSSEGTAFAALPAIKNIPISNHTTGLGDTLKLVYCAPDTDIDTSKIEYTGKHYMTYTDPKVLAVLSSPPYFKDLGHLDGGDSYVCNSETTYGVTKGSGSGSTKSSTISVGAYVSFEHEFTVFGVPVAKIEAEVEYTHGWTKETEALRNVEQTVTYGTFAGQDAVAFYSIPMEVYVYDSYVPVLKDRNLTYEKQTMTVNIPYTAQVKTLSLDSYEEIAANYKELAPISDKVLTHAVGDPTTYPTSVAGYKGVNMPDCDFSGVAFDSLGFNKQSLDIIREKSESTSQSNAINAKVGAGPGSVVVGVTAGYEGGSGKITTSMEGNTFEGVVVNMPISAKDNGYHYSWKVFQYTYTNGDVSFPVVDYLVTDVTSPPKLPEDFALNTVETSDTSVTLSWTCNDASVAGYQVYRHYEFPDGSGDYPVGTIVPGGVYGKTLSFTDKNLNPYTEYEYKIQAIGATSPYESVLSDILKTRTKASKGAPTIIVPNTGITVYPDKPESIYVIVENNAEHAQTPLYQWQKNVEGNWTDVGGATGSKLTFASAGVGDTGKYRCRVNQMVGQFAISAYSDVITVTYEKRVPIMELKVLKPTESGKEPSLSVSLRNSSTDSGSIPTGNVTFEISGTDYYHAYTAKIIGDKAIYETMPKLPDGLYEISAYYTGSRIFESKTAEPQRYLSGIENGYWIQMSESTVYGDGVVKKVNKFAEKDGATGNTDVTKDFEYQVKKEVTERTLQNGNWVYNTVLQNVPGWVDDSGMITAKEVGNYILVADDTRGNTVSKPFSVTKRPIVIEAPTLSKEAKSSDATHPGPNSLKIPADCFASGDGIDSLGLTVECRNTADKIVTISQATEPGNYTTIGTASEGKLSNYEVTWKKGLYTLTGVTYDVSGFAEKLLGDKVAIIKVISPSDHDNVNWSTKYQAGTEIIFVANPLDGYKIDKWMINDKDLTPDQQTAQKNINMLVYTMKGEPLKVSVSFQVGENTLEFNGKNGKAVCTSSDILKSGATVIKNAEYTFKAIPNEGYHFKEWWLVSGSTTYPTGDVDKEGYHTYTLTMSGASTKLFAVFERDKYQITLGEHLEATYLNDHDNNETTSDVAIVVPSGASIPGDKEVTVKPTTGYLVSDQGKWYLDGKKCVEKPDNPATPEDETVYYSEQSYTFTMTTNVAISADLALQNYTVKLVTEDAGGTENIVNVTVDGREMIPDASGDMKNLEGGSRLTFTAIPAYGYVFDKWVVDDKDDETSGSILTASPLGSDLVVKAVFRENEAFQLNVISGIHGELTYKINNGQTVSVTDSKDPIKVYKGDTVALIAIPEDNYMVGKWIVDGEENQTTVKTWTLNNINKDRSVELTFTPMSYYTVNFSSDADGSISATIDDKATLNSGDKPGGGSKIEFTATPAAGYMVEKWEVKTGKDQDFQTVKTDIHTTLVNKSFFLNGLTDDTEVKVSFIEEKTHQITTDTSNGTIVTKFDPDDYADDSTIRDGAAVTFEISPEPGYWVKDVTMVASNGGIINNVDYISKEDGGTWTCRIKNVDDSVSVTVEMAQPYNIKLMPVSGGTISPIIDKALDGEDVTLTASPNQNYKFNNWKVTKKQQVSGVGQDEDITSILITEPTGSAITFEMPAYDITITPSFTYVSPSDTGGGDGGGGGAGGGSVVVPAIEALVEPSDISYTDESVTVTIRSESIEFSEKAAEQLFKDNGKKDLVFSGNGFYIMIPAGTLLSSADLNKMLKGVTNTGSVVKYTDPQGNVSIVKFCIKTNGILTFIANQIGTYETIDNTKTFGDTNKHWAKEAIDFTSSHEIFGGTGNNLFSPNDKMTRAMFVTVLGRVHGISTSDQASFTDVSGDVWYAQFVSWAASKNIVSGVGDNKFAPNVAITREQLCVMIAKYMDYTNIQFKNVNAQTNFADNSQVSSWALDAVTMAQQTGLINGKPGNVFDPQGTATRAEVATMMLNFIKLVMNQ